MIVAWRFLTWLTDLVFLTLLFELGLSVIKELPGGSRNNTVPARGFSLLPSGIPELPFGSLATLREGGKTLRREKPFKSLWKWRGTWHLEPPKEAMAAL